MTYFLFLVLNIFLFLNLNKISSHLKVYDYPDNNRKIHKQAVSYVGGLFIFINFTLIFFLSYFEILNFQIANLNYSIYFFSLFFFILGFLDDKKNLNPFFKLFLLLLLSYFFIKINSEAKLEELIFSFTEKSIILDFWAIPFTIFCYILFINALNFFDGLDLQAGSYTIFFLIVLNFISSNNLILYMFIPIIFFIFYNFKGKVFLGNNGSHFIGFLISYLSIYYYNSGKIIFTDQIVLLMFLPGLDMLRLFIFRLLKKQSPFYADNNHIHHILTLKIGRLNYFLFLIITIVVPNVLYFFNYNFWYLVGAISVIYVYFIFYFKKKL